MEIILLIMLYYLSQNPNFPESVKPLMGSLKNSEEILKFLSDLSKFSDLFSVLGKAPPKAEKPCEQPEKGEKKTGDTETAPTNGIADAFIKECLENYFKKRQ